MGKGGRVVCIFTPMVLTIASFICILLINLGGINTSSDTLNNLYFFEADFSNFSDTSDSTLGTAINLAKQEGLIADFYQIHLWNYCNGTDNSTTQDVTWCSARKTNFWFNPLSVWNLEAAINETASVASDAGVSSSIISELESYVSTNASTLEDELLDASTRKAIKTYQKVSHWMFVCYFTSLWLLLATLGFGILAIFSRWGGFLTWLLAIVSSVFTFAGSIIATVMFSTLVATLHERLKDYNVTVKESTHTLAVTWLATAFILIATLFWLFSACCCSGKSNPHHFRNKAPPAADMGFGRGNRGFFHRDRGMANEKHGAGYEPVDETYANPTADNVPLTHMAASPYDYQETGYSHAAPQSPVWSANAQPHGASHHNSNGAYEPYRYN